MSSILDLIRNTVGPTLDPLMADTYTVTTDPHGTPTVYTCRGVPDNDFESHRENGLSIKETDQVIILFQTASPTLTKALLNPGNYIEGPSDANHRASEKLIISDSIQDPANATFIVSAGT